MTSHRAWWSIAVTAAVIIVIGCGGGSAGFNGSSAGPSPIVLTDTSPGQLNVFVSLNMGGYDSVSRARTFIDIFFQHSGRPVKFTAGEHVICNSVLMNGFVGSFETSMPTESIADKAMTCTYTSGQRSAFISFRGPQQLVIVAPRENEQVPRGAATTVRYSGAMDSSLGVVALSQDAKAVARPKDITPTSASLDTSALGAGKGSIALTDPSSFPLAELQGAQFQSVRGNARRMTMVAVVWV